MSDDSETRIVNRDFSGVLVPEGGLWFDEPPLTPEQQGAIDEFISTPDPRLAAAREASPKFLLPGELALEQTGSVMFGDPFAGMDCFLITWGGKWSHTVELRLYEVVGSNDDGPLFDRLWLDGMSAREASDPTGKLEEAQVTVKGFVSWDTRCCWDFETDIDMGPGTGDTMKLWFDALELVGLQLLLEREKQSPRYEPPSMVAEMWGVK